MYVFKVHFHQSSRIWIQFRNVEEQERSSGVMYTAVCTTLASKGEVHTLLILEEKWSKYKLIHIKMHFSLSDKALLFL